MDTKRFKVDLHVHSKFSTRPSQWILQKIGCAESYTEPELLYNTARARGMDLVTITDHNTIDGALEIAHLPHTFISEEITTYFPEDKCKLHVLVYDITEKHHREIQYLRENVFELVPWLRREKITHVLAHPLFAVNDRLTPEHFEQCLVLFNEFEQNGTRDQMQNDVLTEILDSLTRWDMDRLADKHGLEPLGERAWEKGLTGGSDDHSSLNIARMHTTAPGTPSLKNLLAAINDHTTKPRGIPATPATMAHNLYGIAYQFYKSRLAPQKTASKHLCFRFADHALDFCKPQETGLLTNIKRIMGDGKTAYKSFFSKADSAKDMMLQEATRLIQKDDDFKKLAAGRIRNVQEVEHQWSRFVSQATDRILQQYADRTMDNVIKGRFFDIFHTLGSAGSFYALLASYFVGYDLFSRERAFCDKVLTTFGKEPRRPRRTGLKIAHFTDTFDDVNGVARTIKQQIRLTGQHHKHMTVVTCGATDIVPGVANFRPVGSWAMPEYSELTLHYPPFLNMLTYCFDKDFDFILAATPGPVGMAALAISRILKVPFHSTYHTAFPQYVGMLTDDQVLEDTAWRYMTWFYNQADRVYAPSRATKEELVGHGIQADKIIVYPRGVDTQRFHPAKRNGFFTKRGLEAATKLLYVGRVSKEKDLHILTEAFKKLTGVRQDLHLIVVGDGPYLAEMKKDLRGHPATFTGLLDGDELAEAYASADLFVFPSATDTFGNVVLEAQASGLPAIVSDMGGPQEQVEAEVTGLIAEAGNPDAFARSILHLVESPERRMAMGKRARQTMEGRTFDATFLKTWEIFGETVRNDLHM